MQMEPQEAVDKLRVTVRVLAAFKSYYFDNKARTLDVTPLNPWKFQNSALFGRLDAFLERCNDLLNFSQTALQFHKLERVEIGGTKASAELLHAGPYTFWLCTLHSHLKHAILVIFCCSVSCSISVVLACLFLHSLSW